MSSGDPLLNIPPAFKPIQHYLKTAAEHDKRDPAVAYYCRLYGMQKAMEIDRKSPDCRAFLQSLMNTLEQTKKASKDNEAIQNEVVGQAHVENYALKLFLHADTEDRAARFGKNVVKLFYTAGMLMDVLGTFGEISEEIEKNRKYAKWKAAYIHNCLKNGETPHAGPLDDENAVNDGDMSGAMGGMNDLSIGGGSGGGQFSSNSQFSQGGHPGGYELPPPTATGAHSPSHGPQGGSSPRPVPRPQPPVPEASSGGRAQPTPPSTHHTNYTAGGVKLKPEDYTKAMKFCRYATSALQYEDSKTAVDNLTKALNLLTTGHE